MNRICLICVSACFVVLFSALIAKSDERVADPISVRIVPTSFSKEGARTITLWQPTQHFHVVVTNTSDKPVRLWREWCSWGYYNLSFLVTGEDGKPIVVKKAWRGWKKNAPDSTTLPPGDHMVFEVSFDPKIWPLASSELLPEEGKSREVKMKAVFEIVKDNETQKQDVWTGSVSSPEETYVIY